MNSENSNRLSIIGQRYADALIDIAEENNQLDNISNELDIVANTFSSSADLKTFLDHPKIPIAEKKEVLSAIFGNAISKTVLNFLKLLLDKHRMFIFRSVNRAYKEILAQKRKILVANIKTAVEINDAIKEKLKTKLESIYNKDIQLEYSIDDEIIAGMIVEINDKTIDGSIKTKLENMKKQVI